MTTLKSNTLISTLNGTLVIGFLFCFVLAGAYPPMSIAGHTDSMPVSKIA